MDWQGQQLAEQIMQYALIISAVLAFLTGYIMSSFKLMLMIYAGSVLITMVVIVPDWGYFNRHPLDWMDPKATDPQSAKPQKAKSQTTSKKPTKSLKK